MIKNKIKTKDDLKVALSELKAKKKRIVFTNGCFDLLHAGHVSYLEKAKGAGDLLVIAINSDNSVKRLKGKGRPIQELDDRLKILASLECVDFVTSFDEDTPKEIIEELEPDIIVKGADYKEKDVVGRDHIKKSGGKVIIIPLLQGRSTTSLIKSIKNNG